METYPRAAVERPMKVQEVIRRAIAKKITWAQAGEVIGLSERQMRRWKERYQEFGYDRDTGRGLIDFRRTLHVESFVWTFVVENIDELVEARLLLQKIGCAGIGGFFLQD